MTYGQMFNESTEPKLMSKQEDSGENWGKIRHFDELATEWPN